MVTIDFTYRELGKVQGSGVRGSGVSVGLKVPQYGMGWGGMGRDGVGFGDANCGSLALGSGSVGPWIIWTELVRTWNSGR